ncbi:BCCT family transporter [Natribacillus halophilus]|uniref:Betaine/carnitine transporter, BCCT family n=1 Tax=Natribacillus halophilus TaxID=549003 RepID=A0A1G8SGY3_9BACI|nr:BCCT family transporter [Natribacillus halophilus]SDJ28496.1 betaine/carnitine transporter, BCCT family [Natribacillus halophilus]
MAGKIDKTIFYPSILVVLIVIGLLIGFRETAEPAIEGMLATVTTNLDWAFEFLTIGLFIFFIWLIVGRFGKVKLGDPEDKPEFSRFSWAGMLFTASMGTSIMFWSIVEPLYYYTGPPFGIEPESAEAADYAVTYGLFHWGLSAWALYALPALVIAYSIYVRKERSLRISTACRGVLGKHADGLLGKGIDILVIWSLVGGLGTSLGIGVPMVSNVVSEIIGVEPTMLMNVLVLLVFTAIFSLSAYIGLYKGIRRLSDWNVYMALGLALFVIIVGPTMFLLSYFTNSLGLMFDNFMRMSLHTDPISQSGFPQEWTVFYFAWFAATAPFIGLFVARISKGRTIRDLLSTVILFGSFGSWLYFGVFGGYGMNLELTGQLNFSEIVQESEQAVIVEVLSSLPLASLFLIFFALLGFIYLSTSIDSAAYVLAGITTEKLGGSEQPARWNRLLWGLILATMALSLTLVGGLEVVQSSAVLVSVPVLIMYVLLAVSLYRWLHQDEK